MKVLDFLLLCALCIGLTLAKANKLSINRALKRRSSVKDDSPPAQEDAATELAKYFTRMAGKKKDPILAYSFDEIAGAIRSLMSAENAWKSMDAATHRLRNTFKESTSLQSRYDKFHRKKSRNRKEAAKLLEYVSTVERGMQAAEILQAISQQDNNTRSSYLQEAGLQEIGRVSLDSYKLHVTLSVLRPIRSEDERFGEGELVIALVDGARDTTTAVAQLLRLVAKEAPEAYPLLPAAEALDSDEEQVMLQPALVQLSTMALDQLQGILANCSQAGAVPAEDISSTEISLSGEAGNTSTLTPIWPARVRVLGHSAGGSVASYLAMLLDGTLPLSVFNTTTAPSLAGRFKGNVKCITLGALPCMSRSVVPSFITSIICGDDVVSRAQTDSMASLHRRVLQALKAGAGKKGMLGLLASGSMLKDVSSMAGKSLTRYREARKVSTFLAVPGRAFFIKNRQLKEGATLQRVLRGNWQEDVLWKLHDIVISQKMLEHHTLAAYIRTLNRC